MGLRTRAALRAWRRAPLLTTPENTITCHNALCLSPQKRENENNAYAKFWGDKQRALWYVMVFSGVVN